MRQTLCHNCQSNPVSIRRPSDHSLVCQRCFLQLFEQAVHQTIQDEQMFQPMDRVVLGISGGKDSTVLASVLSHLNRKYNYQLVLLMVCIDEGIKGYRDHSIETVKMNQEEYDLPLHIFSYKDLFGYQMDEIMQFPLPSCTYCGVFRRNALEHAAYQLGATKIVTGHNAEDMAETVLLNMLRGDHHRLIRLKPFKYIYQKEIVLYAHYKNLRYFSTECPYARGSYREYARGLVNRIDTRKVVNVIRSGEYFTDYSSGSSKSSGNKSSGKSNSCGKTACTDTSTETGRNSTCCTKCGRDSNNPVCKGCLLLDGLRRMFNQDSPL